MIMARRLLPSVAILLLLAALACKKTVGENEAIRVAVQKHLAARGTLDLSAMEIDVKQVDIDRDHAIAQVEFRAKRSEEHTSELQSRLHLVCRLLLEKKKKQSNRSPS